MRGSSIFIFIGMMWALLIVGGGIVVTILGPISITGYEDLNQMIASGIKAIIAIILVIIWIVILSKMNKWIFHKDIKS